MSSAASRLIKFGNNASLQNLIQRHLLRPSTAAAEASGAAVTQFLNTVTEPRFSSQFNADKPKSSISAQKASFNASEIILNKYSSNLDVSMVISGDQAGNVKILTRRRGDFNDAYDDDSYSRGFPSSDADSGDEGDEGWMDDDNVDDDNDEDDFDVDDDDDDDDIDGGSKRKKGRF